MNSEKDSTALAIAITSGKGGVGKTNVTTNLGLALAKAGSRVCVLDGDTSLANINILLNLSPTVTFDHYLRGEKSLDDVLLSGPRGMTVVPSATGITDCIDFDAEKRGRLLDCLRTLEREHDYILIDTAAGLGEGVLQFIESAQYAVVVISPEPTSLTDAFSLIKVLKRRKYPNPIYILVNMTNSYGHSMEVFKRFAHAVNKYIEIKVRYLGYIPLDQSVTQAVSKQTPLILSDPDSPAGRCFSLLANILLKHFANGEAPVRRISQFWRDRLDSNPVSEHHVPDGAATTDTLPSSAKTDIDTHTGLPNSKAEAEEQLASLVQHYLTSFGSLPQQAIDLILQAYDQEDLPHQARQQLASLMSLNESSTDIAGAPSNRAVEQGLEELPQEDSMPLAQEIDELVSEAEHTKARLTELAEHLSNQYRRLYNTDIGHASPELRAVNPTHTAITSGKPQRDEKTELLQSIRLASSLDAKK